MNQVFKNYKGQTLIEMIIAIAIGTLVISSILALATRSNRNSNLARASSQASKLAEEGLEIIKNIKFQGIEVIFPNPAPITVVNWVGFYITQDLIGDQFYHLHEPNAGPDCSSTESWCFHIGTAVPETIDLDGQIFERVVIINDDLGNGCNDVIIDPHEIKQFSVVVTWTDPVGEHEQRVVTCIRR